MKSALLVLSLISLTFVTATPALASAKDHVEESLAVAKTWLAQIDAGLYDDSYVFGCTAMREKIKQDKWGLILKSLRTPWGKVVTRQQLSHVYKPNGYEGSEGEYVVITYDTVFQKLNPATEVVVLKWEDGKWLGAGYNAGAKPSPDDADAVQPSSSETEVHTESHVAPNKTQ